MRTRLEIYIKAALVQDRAVAQVLDGLDFGVWTSIPLMPAFGDNSAPVNNHAAHEWIRTDMPRSVPSKLNGTAHETFMIRSRRCVRRLHNLVAKI